MESLYRVKLVHVGPRVSQCIKLVRDTRPDWSLREVKDFVGRVAPMREPDSTGRVVVGGLTKEVAEALVERFANEGHGAFAQKEV